MFEWFLLTLLVSSFLTIVLVSASDALLGRASSRAIDWLHVFAVLFFMLTLFLLFSLFFSWLFGSLYVGMVSA